MLLYNNVCVLLYAWKWKLLSRVWLFLYSPWNSPGQNTGVGSCSLLQGIFPTQGSNPGLLHCWCILYQLSYQGSPRILEWVPIPSTADLPGLGIEPGSPALQANSLPAELPGNPLYMHKGTIAYMSICMKLKLQCFGHLMWIANSLDKILTLGQIEGRRRKGWQRMRWLDAITDSLDMNLGKLCVIMRDREVWCAIVRGVSKTRMWLGDWTATNI